MGRALELITVQATQPNTGAAGAAVSGNSLTIRDSRKAASIIALWANQQGAGGIRLTSPLLHDNTYGMAAIANGIAESVSIYDVPQPVMPQDTLTATISGSNTAGDIEQASFLVAYDDLPGVEGRFITPAQLRSRGVNLFMTRNTISTGTSGGYSGAEAVNAETDAFKANTDYALVGYQVIDNNVTSIRFVGPDWGNLGVGGPAMITTNIEYMARWFVKLSEMTGIPCIPVMNASNKGLTTIEAAANETGGDPEVSTIWVQLK